MLQRKPDTPAAEGYISVVAEHAQAPVGPTSGDQEGQIRRLEGVVADALEQLRRITQEHATLGGQVLALERQVRTLLIERLELSAQVAALQRENALLRAEENPAPPAVRPAPAARHEAPIPLRGATGPMARTPAASPDDETLLMGDPIAEASAALVDGPPPGQTSSGYTLIAQPFARFSDLGRFQTAVQALRGVHNARVRRFAQGTLEMRLDYDGTAPLREALAGLALTVEAIEQLDPQHLVVRLRPDALG